MTKADKQVIQDLLDTIQANERTCAGMAGNRIGILKTVLVARIGSQFQIMVNPEKAMKRGKRTVQRWEIWTKNSTKRNNSFPALRRKLSNMKLTISRAF